MLIATFDGPWDACDSPFQVIFRLLRRLENAAGRVTDPGILEGLSYPWQCHFAGPVNGITFPFPIRTGRFPS